MIEDLGLTNLPASVVTYNEIEENKFKVDEKLMNKIKELKNRFTIRRES